MSEITARTGGGVEALRDIFYRPASLKAWGEACDALDGLPAGARGVALDYAEHHLAAWPAWMRRLDARRLARWEGQEELLALGRRVSLVMAELGEAQVGRLVGLLERGRVAELSLCAVKTAPGCFPRLLAVDAQLDALELLRCEDGTEWHDPRELTLGAVLESPLGRGARSLAVDGHQLSPDEEHVPPLGPRTRALRMWGVGMHGGRLQRLAGLLEAPQLERVELTSNNLQGEGARWLAGRALGHLEALDLSDCGLDAGGAEALCAAARGWGALRELGLGGNAVGVTGAKAALRWAKGQGRALDLSHARLHDAGGGLLVGFGGALERLSLYGSGFQGLGEGFGESWRRLRRLDLGACGLGAAQAAGLAGSPGLAGLESLCLARNALGDEGLAALLEGEGLGAVQAWELWGCGLGDAGAERLARGGLARGREWWLGGNGIGPAGARALASSPALLGVRRLELGGNPLGEEGWEALLGSPYVAPVVRGQLLQQAEVAGFGRAPAPTSGAPAAHSMDTTWFAVDLDGHVGVFDSGEAGAVPEGAGREGARPAQRESAPGEVESVEGLPARGVLLDLRGGVVPWRGHAEPMHMHPHSAARSSVLAGVLDLRLMEDEVAQGRAHPTPAVEGEAFVGLGVRLRSLHRVEAHGEWIAMDSFWSDQHAMGRRGLYQYEHLTENWTSGPYGRSAVPEVPLRWEELPARVREDLGAARLPVRFAQARHVQPVSHGPCRSWQSTYMDVDGNTHELPE